jgi:hypothetical protein
MLGLIEMGVLAEVPSIMRAAGTSSPSPPQAFASRATLVFSFFYGAQTSASAAVCAT